MACCKLNITVPTAIGGSDEIIYPHPARLSSMEVRQKPDGGEFGYGNEKKVAQLQARYIYENGWESQWFDVSTEDVERYQNQPA